MLHIIRKIKYTAATKWNKTHFMYFTYTYFYLGNEEVGQ